MTRELSRQYEQESSGSTGDGIIETLGLYCIITVVKFGVNDRGSNGTGS